LIDILASIILEHMSALNLTAGAHRVLAGLRQQTEQSGVVVYRWLIQNMLDDEGHATEILRSFDVRLPDDAAFSADPIGVPYSEWQQAFLRKADHYSILTNNNGPTGTEHLLLAAMELDPATASFLQAFGLQRDHLIDLVTVAQPDLAGPESALVQIRPAGVGHVEEGGLYRILDASANRAREGLRVVEDYVRFQLNDAVISGELKSIRHVLTTALQFLGQSRWVPSRDTLQDVGTRGSLATERQRGSLIDVLRANMKRAEEAIRSLEEYSKLLDSDLGEQIGQARYRMYTVEKSLEAAIQSRERLADAQLYLLVTAASCRYGAEETIRHSLEMGVDVVQLREKEMGAREMVAYGERVREMTAAAGKLLIINDRADIAAAIGADGVHLGQEDLSVQAARQVLGGAKLIGVSSHTPEQARQAIFDGADYLGAGPVFPSNTKEFTRFAGLELIEYMANHVCIPWFAIGGIRGDNLSEVTAAGGTRIAVSNVICSAPHPRGVVSDLKEKLTRASARLRP